jgi:hypothetical protein
MAMFMVETAVNGLAHIKMKKNKVNNQQYVADRKE